MGDPGPTGQLKKGSAEVLVLALLAEGAQHGYQIAKLIETRSEGRLRFHAASLYPTLYRLEERGWIRGEWVHKPGQRKRRYYRLTRDGRTRLAAQRRAWSEFLVALDRVADVGSRA